MARPGASFATVRGWSNVPTPQSEQITELVLGEAVGPLVDMDRPIDFAVSYPTSGPSNGPFGLSEPLSAVSFGLRNPAAAKAALSDKFKLVPSKNGVLRLEGSLRPPRHDDDDDEDASDVRKSCELAPAFGPSSLRLVCAFGSDKALDALGPWLTRGATRETSSSDFHVEVSMQPLRAAIFEQGKMLGALLGGVLGSSLPLPSLRSLVMGGAQDLADFLLDLSRETVDVKLSDAGAQADFAIAFGSSSSTLARLLTDGEERIGPPPAAFWQMPGDAVFAGFGRGVNGATVAHARGLLLQTVGEELAENHVKAADRNAIVAALEKLPVLPPSAFAAGVDIDSVEKALGALAATADPPGDAADATKGGSPKVGEALTFIAGAQLFGWHLVEFDAPSSQLSGALTDLSAVWGRPSVVAAYREAFKGSTPPALRPATMPKGQPWPKDATHFVVELQPKAAQTPAGAKPPALQKAVTFHVLVVPDGVRTWVAIAGDESLAVAKLRAAMAGAGDTLAARTELGPWKGARLLGGGFLTLRGIAAQVSAAAAIWGPLSKNVTEPFRLVQQLPHQGMTPLMFTSTMATPAMDAGEAKSSPPADAPKSFRASIAIPRAAIDDVIVAVALHGGL
jgi:hypothetical protein